MASKGNNLLFWKTTLHSAIALLIGWAVTMIWDVDTFRVELLSYWKRAIETYLLNNVSISWTQVITNPKTLLSPFVGMVLSLGLIVIILAVIWVDIRAIMLLLVLLLLQQFKQSLLRLFWGYIVIFITEISTLLYLSRKDSGPTRSFCLMILNVSSLVVPLALGWFLARHNDPFFVSKGIYLHRHYSDK
jgi:hypothetical protein